MALWCLLTWSSVPVLFLTCSCGVLWLCRDTPHGPRPGHPAAERGQGEPPPGGQPWLKGHWRLLLSCYLGGCEIFHKKSSSEPGISPRGHSGRHSWHPGECGEVLEGDTGDRAWPDLLGEGQQWVCTWHCCAWWASSRYYQPPTRNPTRNFDV